MFFRPVQKQSRLTNLNCFQSKSQFCQFEDADQNEWENWAFLSLSK
jgi:hypothetical protein